MLQNGKSLRTMRFGRIVRRLFREATSRCVAGLPKRIRIPIRYVVANEAIGTTANIKVVVRGNRTTVNFLDRCRLLGLEHELGWYWARTLASERWRQLASRYHWVFVLGCNNSGTTLMARLLESHPEISGVPLGGRGATVVLLAPRRVNLIRLWTERVELFRLTDADQDLDALRLAYDWVSAVRFSTRPFVLEKAPPDMVCSRWLQSVFPNASFIGLVRNGYAVAEGINRREGYSLDRCARHWNNANKIMMDDSAHLKRFALVSYEDLTRDGRTTMRRLSGFLGLDSDPLEAAIDKEWQVHKMHGAPAKIRDFNGESLARLSKADMGVIGQHAQEMLGRFGYFVPSGNSCVAS